MYLGTINQLGALPSPSSLVSVPVSSDTVPTWVNSLQGQAGMSTSAGGTSSYALPPPAPPSSVVGYGPVPSNPPFAVSFTPSVSHPGMILSPAADPIPHTLVQRIQSGQFVEMRDLLADNIALHNQLASLQGTVSLPLITANQTRLREVPSLVSWLYCFAAYVAVRTSDPLTRNMLAYSRLIIREALRHGGLAGWSMIECSSDNSQSIRPCRGIPWNQVYKQLPY